MLSVVALSSTSKTSKICQDDWAFQRKAKASASKISIQQILEISINFHFCDFSEAWKRAQSRTQLDQLGDVELDAVFFEARW